MSAIRFALVPLMLALSVSTALAEDDDNGRADFDKANRYFEAEEYQAALPFYERAYELSGHRASTIRALAQCERALGLYDRAVEHYREYLQTEPEDASRIAETIMLLEDLRREKKKRQREDEAKAREDVPPESSEPASMPQPAPAPEPAPVAVTETAPPPEDDSIVDSPIFWVAVAGVAVLGGALVVVAASSSPEPYGGTTDQIFER